MRTFPVSAWWPPSGPLGGRRRSLVGKFKIRIIKIYPLWEKLVCREKSISFVSNSKQILLKKQFALNLLRRQKLFLLLTIFGN